MQHAAHDDAASHGTSCDRIKLSSPSFEQLTHQKACRANRSLDLNSIMLGRGNSKQNLSRASSRVFWFVNSYCQVRVGSKSKPSHPSHPGHVGPGVIQTLSSDAVCNLEPFCANQDPGLPQTIGIIRTVSTCLQMNDSHVRPSALVLHRCVLGRSMVPPSVLPVAQDSSTIIVC